MSAHLPRLFDRSTATQECLRDKQQLLFSLLIDREREFGFHADIVTAYPEPLDALLRDPVAYLQAHIHQAESARARPFQRAVVLTTYGNLLGGPLVGQGYHEEIIHMPAGPENTRFYARQLKEEGVGIFYLEAVNELDEKIQSSFVSMLEDDDGKLLAGMSGSVWESHGKRHAYISTVVARKDAPAGTGSRVAEHVWQYLADLGVVHVNLGTQTADSFYKKQGFRTIHSIVPRLRYRQLANGNRIWHDLVIMQKDL